MKTTTLTVRVDDSVKRRLDKLARNTGRTRSFLAAEAIDAYLAVNEWQVAGIKQAMASLDDGRSVPHQSVRDWVMSWGTETEKSVPKPAKR